MGLGLHNLQSNPVLWHQVLNCILESARKKFVLASLKESDRAKANLNASTPWKLVSSQVAMFQAIVLLLAFHKYLIDSQLRAKDATAGCSSEVESHFGSYREHGRQS